jgi:hypothetical protein
MVSDNVMQRSLLMDLQAFIIAGEVSVRLYVMNRTANHIAGREEFGDSPIRLTSCSHE